MNKWSPYEADTTYDEHDDLIPSRYSERREWRGDHERHNIREQRSGHSIEHQGQPLVERVNLSSTIETGND